MQKRAAEKKAREGLHVSIFKERAHQRETPAHDITSATNSTFWQHACMPSLSNGTSATNRPLKWSNTKNVRAAFLKTSLLMETGETLRLLLPMSLP